METKYYKCTKCGLDTTTTNPERLKEKMCQKCKREMVKDVSVQK